MNIDIEELLRRTLAVAEENNKMLHRIEKRQRWSTYVYVAKWTIFIVLTLGTAYYVQPYVENALKVYTNFNDSATSIREGAKNFSQFFTR